MIPFFQGENRYLSETYITEKQTVKKLTGLIDFFFFFIEGMIFYAMALLIKDNYNFFQATGLVFLVDLFWLGFVFFTNKDLFKKIQCWFWLNLVAVSLIAITLALSVDILEGSSKYTILAGFLILRTLLDYKFASPFYWPYSTNKKG